MELVLTQMRSDFWKPGAYFSRRLNKSEKELYAIVLAVEYFRQFLYGTEFKVTTDHKPLKYTLTVKEPASRLLRWLNRLNIGKAHRMEMQTDFPDFQQK